MQNRFRSKVAWGTLLPIVLILGDVYGLWEIINMPKDSFTKLVISIGSALTAFGVFNNPEKLDKY